MEHMIVSRSVHAPINEVWGELTDPVRLAAWFWPPSFHTSASLDLVAGGRWRIAATSPTMAVGGVVRRVAAPTKLALTWRWDGEQHESDVTIELGGDADGTLVEVTHHGLPDQQARIDHEQGWTDCLSRLLS